MKQIKFNKLLAILKSASDTGHISLKASEPSYGWALFDIDGVQHEILWDEFEHECELAVYKNRREFTNLGKIEPDALQALIYKSPGKE